MAAAFGGLGAGNLAAARAATQIAGGKPGTDDPAVIFVWLPGGASHLETFDLKPDAPAEIRGEFRPVRTNVAGVDICEHMPLLAQLADKYNIIRSVAHEFADHGGGHKRFMTARPPLQPVGFVNDHPAMGSMIAKVSEKRSVGVPNYICEVDGGRQGIDTFSLGSAYLGPATHPFNVVGDPNDKAFTVRDVSANPAIADRLPDRLGLLKALDRMSALEADRTGTMAAMDENQDKAMELLTGDVARTAFDLSREPDKLRDRYGRHRFGQRCLLARRLIEAGSLFVTVVLENPGVLPADTCYNWDSHAVNCHLFTDTKYKLGFYDRAVSALIEDIYARGLDRRVLLVVTGEFGRTPRISYSNGRPGRDHWPAANSLIVSGGAMRTGQVVGSTTSKGEHPKDRPLSPDDLWATVLTHLRIDYNKISFLDRTGRPMPMLQDGAPISELLATA